MEEVSKDSPQQMPQEMAATGTKVVLHLVDHTTTKISKLFVIVISVPM